MDDFTFEQELLYKASDELEDDVGSSPDEMDTDFDLFSTSKPQIEKDVELEKKRSAKPETQAVKSSKSALKLSKDTPICLNKIPLSSERGTSFELLGLSKPILKTIKECGFEFTTKIQESAIPLILKGKDVFACARTGSGKTAAFLLPIIERLLFRQKDQRITRVVILLPTRELALQVFNVATLFSKYTDIAIALSTGGQSNKTEEITLRKKPDILISTPGRLIDHLYNCVQFNLENVEILVFDEADRLLDEHFKEQIHEIVRLSSKSRQTLMFSATLSEEIKKMIKFSLSNPIKLTTDSSKSTVPTLDQQFIKINSRLEEKREAIVAALCHDDFAEAKSIIVFCSTKKITHRMYTIIRALELSVVELHGDMSQSKRFESFQQFQNKKCHILVTTNLASRGLDIDDVEGVINMYAPSTYQDYIHRVGRTARIGKYGRSVTLIGAADKLLWKEIRKNNRESSKLVEMDSEKIEIYSLKIEKLCWKIKEYLTEDERNKEMERAEKEIQRAENLMKHQHEINSRPKRKWFETKKSKGIFVTRYEIH